MLELTATPFSTPAMPSVPLAVPPNACDSPIVRSSLLSCMVAATAVRPNCASADLDARGGEPQIKVEIVKAIERDRQAVPIVFIAGKKPHAGNIGRQIQRVRRKRALHQPVAVGRQRQRAFGTVAVELDIDVGQGRHAAADIALGAKREAAEAAERDPALAGPVQRVTQRGRLDVKRAVEL